ncbi:MAG: PDZ domain-containing protein [Planctomycetes bacterium]|nr:PDZ domain-containing protein [Planctomycetota bacterium]
MRPALRFVALPLLAVFAAATAPAADRPAPTATTTVTEKPRLGVQIDEGSIDDPAANGLPVAGVAVGSTAAAMGIQSGDKLKSLNGTVVRSVVELQNLISALKIGDTLTAEVVRKGKPLSLAGTLQSGSSAEAVREQLNQARKELDELRKRYGIVSGREPTLAEMIQQLKMLEEQFPRAAAEFKKVYPNGEFAIAITITSDKAAKNPVDLMTADPGIMPGAGLPKEGAPAAEGAPAKPATEGAAPAPATKKQ